MYPHKFAAVAVTLAVGSAAPASAQTFVAGWDFSQYLGAGSLTTDGETLATRLPANYSDYDPTSGAGAEAAAYGTMYNDGTNGSTESTLEFTPYLPTAQGGVGGLQSNIDEPVNDVPDDVDVPFNSLTTLDSEFPGRAFPHQDLAMISNGAHMVVFQADFSSAPTPPAGTGWVLSFGARVLEAGTIDVDVDFGLVGQGFSNVDTVTITTVEERFEVALGSTDAESALVRLVFPQPSGPTNSPIIDNVAITVPEPGAGAALSAFGALAALARRRRAGLVIA